MNKTPAPPAATAAAPHPSSTLGAALARLAACTRRVLEIQEAPPLSTHRELTSELQALRQAEEESAPEADDATPRPALIRRLELKIKHLEPALEPVMARLTELARERDGAEAEVKELERRIRVSQGLEAAVAEEEARAMSDFAARRELFRRQIAELVDSPDNCPWVAERHRAANEKAMEPQRRREAAIAQLRADYRRLNAEGQGWEASQVAKTLEQAYGVTL